MFHETKVLDALGNLKKIISGNELKRRHWENFKILEENCNSFSRTSRKGNSRKSIKKTSPSLENVGDDTY